MRERNIGLDLCRILSMLGIVLIHVIDKGKVLAHCPNYGVSYWVTEWIYICVLCSVDIFGMLSGFFGIKKKNTSTYRAVELIAVVLFWSLVITCCFVLFAPNKIGGIGQLISGLCPPLAGAYWYITCYVPIMLLQPYINKMLLSLSEKQHLRMILLAVFVFSCIPSLIREDFFRFEEGYSFVWLLLLYVIGAYFGRCTTETFSRIRKTGGFIFFFLSFVLLLGNILGLKVFDCNIRYLVSYVSPVTLGMAVSAIMVLSSVSFKGSGKFLIAVSATAFDIYIIHSHLFIYDHLLQGAFGWLGRYPWYGILVLVPLCAGGIFAVCSVLGFMRAGIFRITKLNNVLARISGLFDRLIYE